MRRLSVVTVLALAVSPAAFADSYREGRIRYVDEGVSIQRATETGSEEATPNLPFLPGDRVWTNDGGRAEFQFAGGSLLRLDAGSKLDYVAHDEGRDDRVVLRLWSGALFLHVRDRRDGPFEVETPGGVVTSSRGVVRIDVQSGETRVSVYEGEAGLDGAQPIRIRAGERLYARRGEVEEGPTTFDRTEGDEFADWDNGRREQASSVSSRPAPLPDEIAPYADELDRHGAWYYETEVGHVWRPYVAAGWQPYSSGRWVWSIFGWTWVPYETWGWAPSHFGRWGFTPALGWYWIPGAAWSPAWVSWAVGGDYVGWCPLGYRDRPVLVYDRLGRGDRGHAFARGTSVATAPWIYTRRGDLVARDLPRRRVQLDGAAVQQVRVVEQARARLGRDFSVTDAPAGAIARGVPRNTSTRPGMADTVPEMRSDPMSSIPVVRRRGRPADGRDEPISAEAGASGAVPRGNAWGREGAPVTPANGTRPVHPTDVRSGRQGGEVESGGVPRRRPGTDVEARTPDPPVRQRDGLVHEREGVPRERDGGVQREGGVVRERPGVVRERQGGSDAEREVLRPMFRPLGRSRNDGQDGEAPRSGETGAVRRGGEGEPRRGGGEGRPTSTGGSRERESAPPPRPAPPPRNEPPRNEPQAQPRHEAPPPPPPSGAAARRPRRDQ